MNDYIAIAQIVLSLVLFPILGYVMRIERRITVIETKLDMHLKRENRGEK